MPTDKFHIKFDEAVDYAGSQADLARMLRVTESAVTQWKPSGVLPEGSSYKLAAIAPGRFSPPNRIDDRCEAA